MRLNTLSKLMRWSLELPIRSRDGFVSTFLRVFDVYALEYLVRLVASNASFLAAGASCFMSLTEGLISHPHVDSATSTSTNP